MSTAEARALFSKSAEALPPRSDTRAGSAELRPADDFDAVALANGYSAHATQLMREGATALALPIPLVTTWLDIGVTPWGAEAWLAQGFAEAEEAREYRRWGFAPRDAYWARRDGLTATSLRQHRHLLNLLARSPR